MSVDKSKMVLTFKHPRISRGEQERLGRAYFAGTEPHVLHVGVLPKLAIDVARATREGDEVWFYGLNMIVAPRKDAEEIGATQITMFIKTIAANRATGIEGNLLQFWDCAAERLFVIGPMSLRSGSHALLHVFRQVGRKASQDCPLSKANHHQHIIVNKRAIEP